MQTVNELDQSFQDVHNTTKCLAVARLRLKAENFSEKDKKNIADFLNYLSASGISDGRVLDASYKLVVMRRHLRQCDFQDVTRPEMEELMKWLTKDSGYTAYTKSSIKGWIKRFYKWLKYKSTSKTYSFPPLVKWIPTNVKINEIKEPKVLTDDEITKIIEVAKDNRDKALIAVGAEGGFRIGELLRMRLRDLEQTSSGFRAHVSGKTGPRTVLLITSATLLARYLEEHPGRNESQSPLWVSMSRRKKLLNVSYQNARKLLKDVVRNAGIQKRVYPHILRHSAATRDARYLNEPELRIKYGWSRFSGMPSTYCHLNTKAVEDKLIHVYGDGKEVNTEPEKPKNILVICARCKFKNTPGTRFCGQCGTTLNEQELAKMTVQDETSRKEAEELLTLFKRAIASSGDSFEKFKEAIKVGFVNP